LLRPEIFLDGGSNFRKLESKAPKFLEPGPIPDTPAPIKISAPTPVNSSEESLELMDEIFAMNLSGASLPLHVPRQEKGMTNAAEKVTVPVWSCSQCQRLLFTPLNLLYKTVTQFYFEEMTWNKIVGTNSGSLVCPRCKIHLGEIANSGPLGKVSMRPMFSVSHHKMESISVNILIPDGSQLPDDQLI